MKWYQTQEKAAGEKRLMLTWYLYKLFGKGFVRKIASTVAFFAFCCSKNIQNFTKKNLAVIYEYTNNPHSKPTIKNQYKLVQNYAHSLVDKMEVFAGKYNAEKIVFENENAKKELIEDIKNNKGVFFICTHIGNIDILRAFIEHPKNPVNPHVNIFLSKEQCKIFNNFLKKVAKEKNITTYPVENIGIETGSEIKEKLENGEIVFIAGDRISAATPSKTANNRFLNRTVEFPIGTFKFAQLMDTQIYFICATNDKNDNYKVFLQKFYQTPKEGKKGALKRLQDEYATFLSHLTSLFPLQFYHFYDIFDDVKN